MFQGDLGEQGERGEDGRPGVPGKAGLPGKEVLHGSRIEPATVLSNYVLLVLNGFEAQYQTEIYRLLICVSNEMAPCSALQF